MNHDVRPQLLRSLPCEPSHRPLPLHRSAAFVDGIATDLETPNGWRRPVMTHSPGSTHMADRAWCMAPVLARATSGWDRASVCNRPSCYEAPKVDRNIIYTQGTFIDAYGNQSNNAEQNRSRANSSRTSVFDPRIFQVMREAATNAFHLQDKVTTSTPLI